MAANEAPDRHGDTASAILDVAQGLVQTRGFNGFSYADIAGTLGITKAALHYHFASKADLGRALLTRYVEMFLAALGDIDRDVAQPAERLAAYASLYVDVLAGDRLCLCGMLAAERDTLPDEMRAAVVAFFDANIAWLESVLAAGVHDGSLHLSESPRDVAEMLLGGLEGGMLVAWSHGASDGFRASARRLIASLTTAPGPPPDVH